MKNAVFWDGTPCGSYKNRRFGGTYRLHHQGDKNQHSVLRLLVTANVIPSSSILVSLIIEALRSSESSVLIRATWPNIPGDGILQMTLRANAISRWPKMSSDRSEL
jgi:hypothetical protein